ncbi:MAG: carbon-nitrogen hydrolase family protein [Phycisphaerae bacterium]
MTASRRTVYGVAAVCMAAVLASPSLAAEGNEASRAETAGAGRPAGRRSVGVSCICRPARSSAENVERWIDTAVLDKPDIILLTEGFMHNTDRSATEAEKNAGAEPLSGKGPILSLLGRKAREHKTYIMGSTWRKNPKRAGRYNTAFLVDRTGKVVWHYDKTFPTIGEMESGILPGRGAKVFDTDFGRIGALICFDLNFEELLDTYKREGVELLCFLSAFRGGLRVPALAFHNQCFVASSVPGENGVIVDPLGRTLAESSQYGRIIFARIELDARVVHIDYNHRRIPDLKKKYGELVRIETASPEAVYLLTSLHPEVSVDRMIEAFEIETLDAYLDRARAVRKEHLPAE